jgi:threonine aldolase
MAGPHFGSDNVSGIAPEILEAIAAANRGGVDSYGGDVLSTGLTERFSKLFETPVSVLPVGTGTIANCLSLALATPPWGAVFCSEQAHIVVDEANGPEFFTGGAKLTTIPTADGRLAVDDVRRAATAFDPEDVHHPRRAVLSITQSTETGTLYNLDTVRALGALARELGLAFHMDGARFANAVAALRCSPAELTWKAGVDVLSFGATKNGALGVEAVIIFDPALAESFAFRRKRAGHLFSKMRLLSAQMATYLENDLWLRNARHANAMAAELHKGLAQINSVRFPFSADANMLFPELPAGMADALHADGFQFYDNRWAPGIVRLVTAFNTDENDVEALIAAARRHAGGGD